MTVSSSQGRQLTIEQHINLAFKTSGVVEASQSPATADVGMAQHLLENILDALETYGVFAKAVEFSELSLAADQYVYSMPSDVSEVIKDGMYIPASEDVSKADGETPVIQIQREEWHRFGTKGTTSDRPSNYFCDRSTNPVKVYIWPIPSEAGTIRFQVQKHLADADSTSATLNLEVFWNKYIQYALAAAIAETKSLNLQKISYLEAKSRQELLKCQGRANEFSPNQIYIDHGVHK